MSVGDCMAIVGISDYTLADGKTRYMVEWRPPGARHTRRRSGFRTKRAAREFEAYLAWLADSDLTDSDLL